MISITVDPKALITTMGAAANQLPFATAKALNECAVGFQTDERAVMQQDFIIRRPWVLQRVKIDRGDFATKTKLSVRIRIDDQGDFLNKFEGGGIRTPGQGDAASSSRSPVEQPSAAHSRSYQTSSARRTSPSKPCNRRAASRS
jgi:hypothetical protein